MRVCKIVGVDHFIKTLPKQHSSLSLIDSNSTIIENYNNLKEGKNIEYMSISMIANATFTSAPLLVRIAKKLGFVGWSEFKDAYVKELDYLYHSNDVDASIPFVVTDDYMKISFNIAQLEIETIQDTLSLIKHDDLYQAMRYIRNATYLDLYAISNNVVLAEEFAEKMFFINKTVNISRYTGDAKLQASMSTNKHVAILISYSGETPFMIDVAKILKKKNTPIIAITSIGDNSLSLISDVALRMSSREMLHTKIGAFATSQSVKTILDILYACIFSLDYQKNLENKILLAREADDRHSGFEFINEE